MQDNTDHLLLQVYELCGFSEEELQANLENHIWITAYKKRIPAKELTTGHIKNIIRCFEGKGRVSIPANYLGGKSKWMKILKEELNNRNQWQRYRRLKNRRSYSAV